MSEPTPVEVDVFAGPWTIENFAAAILTNGPIRVSAKALTAVRRRNLGLVVYQEWDEATQTMTYTIPER